MAVKATGPSTSAKPRQVPPHAHQGSRSSRLWAVLEALASDRPPAAIVDTILHEVALVLNTPHPVCLLHLNAAGDAFVAVHSLANVHAAAGQGTGAPAPWAPGGLPLASLATAVREGLARGEAHILATAAEALAAGGPPAAEPLPRGDSRAWASESLLLLLPVRRGKDLAGLVAAGLSHPRLSRAESEALDLLSKQMAVALRQEELVAAGASVGRGGEEAAGVRRRAGRLEEEQAAAMGRLGELYRAAVSLLGNLDFEDVADTIVAQSVAVLRADAAALFVPGSERETYEIRAQHGLVPSYATRARIRAADVRAVAGVAAGRGRSYDAGDRAPRWVRRLLAAGHARSVVLNPLWHGGRLAGMLALLLQERQVRSQVAPAPEAIAFGNLAAAALESAGHHRETEHGATESTFLLQIGQLLSATFEVPAIVGMITEEAGDLLASDVSALYLYDPLDGSIELQAVQGANRRKLVDAGLQRLRLDRLPATERITAGVEPVACDWPGEGDLLSLFGPLCRVQASLTVPLRARNTLLGLLFLGRRAPRRFGLADVLLATKLGALGALALDNARLYANLTDQMQQLRAAQTQLIEAEKMVSLGRIVAGVAHALNNPLAVISGYAQMLLDGDAPAEMRSDLESIDRGARRAAEVVRELLAFARQQPMVPSTIEVADLVQRALQREEYALRQAGIDIVLAIGEDLPRIRGDVSQLERVLGQLVANARQATAGRAGGSRLTISASYRDRLLLAVSDEGPGIPDDLLDKVFEPFLTTRPVGQGMGLGLSMCYGVVRAHGGRIWAANNPGPGATVYVELPPAPRDEAPAGSR